MPARPDSTMFDALTHDPQRRANFEASALEARCAQISAKAQALVAMEGAQPIPTDVVARLIERHERATQAYWHAESRCMSPMIVGPARFPTERNAKRQRTADKRRSEVTTHLSAALRRLERLAFPHGMPGSAIRSDDPDALAKLQAKHADLETQRERTKAVAKLARKGDWAAVADLIGAQRAAEAKRAQDEWRIVPFSTDRINAEMRRVSERIEALNIAKSRPTMERVAAGGVRVVENSDLDRLQLFYPDKPDEAARRVLKSAGFRWAPSEGAWQRQLTNNARWAAQRLLGPLSTAADIESGSDA